MVANELTILKKEIEQIKLQICKIYDLLKAESDNTTHHIKYIYNYLKILDDRSMDMNTSHNELIFKLYDMIEPIEEKIFPGVSKARQQLAAIIEGLASDRDQKKS